MGRVGVPIAYTWPAGLGGIRGYAYDRESGEFTVGHLREFIRSVATCPGVERVHLVAHSLGVHVTISALLELHLIYAAQGKSTQCELKLENLVLAAPDVDEELFMQRFVGENLLKAARRTTIYASQYDKAIELSDIIFASRRRLGTLAVKDFSPKMKQGLAKLPNVQFIECKVSGWLLSHSYVFTHPAALSDLILVLRDRRDPGAANGRPLRQRAEGIWELTDDYLAR
jgi:esterase/lipase superfamily enzyme